MDAVMDGMQKLMGQKKALFALYEEATQALLACDADSAEQYIIRRDELATGLGQVQEEMARLCDGHPDKARIMDAVFARIDFDKVPGGYETIYYEGQAIRGMGGRIGQMDRQVVQRLETWRDEALAAVKKNQNMPKIKKYLTDLTESPGAPGSLRDEKV